MDGGDCTTPTEVLRDEHTLILEVAASLEYVLAKEVNGVALDYDGVERYITFFRLFADACHHGKEEDLLFPELENAGLPHDAGPIAVMLYEHELGRGFVRTMANSIEGARSGSSQAHADLTAAALDFIELIVAHIGKENDVLFNMADGMIVGPECASLCSRYAETCSRRYEGKTRDDLRMLADEILGRN